MTHPAPPTREPSADAGAADPAGAPMRVTLLPRAVAARVITSSVATLAWASGLAIVVISIPTLVESMLRRGVPEAIPVPLTMLLVVLAGIVVCLRWMRPAAVAGYLALATAASVVYATSLVQTDPTLLGDELYVINRPTLALVTIGVASSSALAGVAWCVAGYAAAWLVPLATAALTGHRMSPGLGPTMVLVVAIITYATLFAIQARQRRTFPAFDRLEEDALRRTATADLAQRTTAVVHDTLLNDLTIIMNAPDQLRDSARARLLDDLATLEGGAWMRASETVGAPGAQQALVRNELDRLASDFRWRGLTVNVTGVRNSIFQYRPGVGEALVGALRAALENVLAHSGSRLADVEVMYTDDEIVFVVSDQGVGFDPDAVPAERLGVRGSIVGRMEAVGGRAQLWSTPGAGTTVLIAAPVSVQRGPRTSHHQELDGADE